MSPSPSPSPSPSTSSFSLPHNHNPDPESATLLPTKTTSPSTKPLYRTHPQPLPLILKTTLLTSLFWLSLLLLFFILSTNNPLTPLQKDTLCLSHTTLPSPVLTSLSHSLSPSPSHSTPKTPIWRTQTFNGTFLHLNAYRGDAGTVVDEAWEGLGVDYRSVLIPATEAERSGISKDQVHVTERYGGGYPANVEGLHHLHCLNLLRKSLHWNYDYYRRQGHGAFSNDEYIARYHVTHCLDILRQQLMCVTDVGVLGQVWWKPEDDDVPQPFVDFNTKHRCRDFEAVRAWAEKHQMPPESEVDMKDFYEMPGAGDRVYSEIP